jgi:hypothetical protein
MTLSYRPNAFQNATVPTEPSPRENIFRAFHPRPMSADELRPPRDKAEIMRRELPYGIWRCADGREVLFNRRYRPLMSRYPGQMAQEADPMEWIDWVDQQWFYCNNAPWWSGDPISRKAGKETRKRCEKALQDFWDGRPVTGMRHSWREECRKLMDAILLWEERQNLLD